MESDEEYNKFEIEPEYKGKVDAWDVLTSSTIGNSTRLSINKRKGSSIIILADSNNTDIVYVGKDQPTFPLSAGQSIPLRDLNPDNVLIKSDTANQKIHVIMSY